MNEKNRFFRFSKNWEKIYGSRIGSVGFQKLGKNLW